MVEQKKEMFLVTMSHGIIENEIKMLKQSQFDKQMALEKSKKMIEDDIETFNSKFQIKKNEVET